MSLKGFLENLTEKLTKQFNLDAEKVQAYLDSHTQEMQELLDDKELSLKEKVLFVRSEITGEKDEAVKPSEAIQINTPIVLYKGDAENAEKAFKYLCDKIPNVKSAYFYCDVKPTGGNNYCGVGIKGPRTYAQDMFYYYSNLFNDDFWNNCDADPQGWVDPLTINRYDVATPRQEFNKQTNEMVGNKKWVIRIKRLGKNYYVCSSSFRVNKAFRYPSLGGPFVCSDWDITERDIAKYDNYNDAKKAWDGMAQVLRGGLPFYKEGEDYEIVQVNFSMMGESKKHEGYGGSTSVMGIWGKRPRDVYPEVSYSSVNDMYNTLLKYGYGDKHPIYYKNNSPEQIKRHILGYFKWIPTNSDADIEADALTAATMIKNNFNKSESKKHEGFNTTRDLNNFALHILNYIKDKTHYPGYIRFVKLNDDEEDFYGKYFLSVNGKNYYLYVGDTDYSITDNNDENTLVEGSTDLSGAMQKDLNDFCERITQPFYTESKEPADEKLGYEKGHKNSRGEDAPWVIRSHEDNRILASFANKKDAEEHMKRMKQYSKSESYELASKEIQVRKPNGTWQRWSVTWPEYVDTHIQDAKDQGWTEVRVVDIKRNENTEEHKKSEGLSNEKVKDAVKFAATEAGLENYLNVNSDGAMSVTVSLPINSDDLKTVRWVIDSNDGTITEYLDTEKNLTRDFTDDESLVSMLTLLFQTSRMELRDWLPKKSESVNMGGFKNMLRTYNAKGGSVKNGPWRICDGAYDLWFELYYNDTPILGCTDNICKWYSNPETVGMTLDDYKKIEDAISSEIFAIDSFKMPESKKSESLADNPSDIHTQLSNLIKQDKIITFLNDGDGPVIYMDASKGSIPYGDYLLKYLGIDSSAMMISSATVYNVEDIESYDILNGLSSSFVDSQKKKGINKVCKITTKYLTKPKKSESREDGENAYDDYWTLIDGLKALGFEPSSDIRNGMIYPYRTHFTATKDGIKYVFILNEDQTGEYLESIKVYGGIFDKGDPNDPDPTRFKSVSEVLDALKKVSDEPQKYEGADTTKEVNTVLKKNAPQLIDILNSKFKEAGFDVELKLTDPENARFSDGWYLKTKGTGNWTDPSRRLNLQLNGTEYKGVVYKDGAIYLKKGMRPTSHRGEVVNPLGIGESNSDPENTVTYELTEDAVTNLIKELGLKIVNTWYDGNKDRIVYDCKDKGDENGETVCVWIEPPYEARVWLKDVNPRVNQLVEDIGTLDALKTALVDIFKIELGENHVTESLRKPENTIIVPNWLWETYTLGENYDGDTLTDDEQQTYLDFKEKYEGFSLQAVSKKTAFRSDNDFDSNGCPCYEVNVFKK